MPKCFTSSLHLNRSKYEYTHSSTAEKTCLPGLLPSLSPHNMTDSPDVVHMMAPPHDEDGISEDFPMDDEDMYEQEDDYDKEQPSVAPTNRNILTPKLHPMPASPSAISFDARPLPNGSGTSSSNDSISNGNLPSPIVHPPPPAVSKTVSFDGKEAAGSSDTPPTTQVAASETTRPEGSPPKTQQPVVTPTLPSTPPPPPQSPHVSFHQLPQYGNGDPYGKSAMSSPQSPNVASDASNFSNNSPKSHSVLTIEHTVNSNNGGQKSRSALLLGVMTKPTALMAIGAYLLFMTGSAGFFFSRFLRLPGLNDQIEELEVQVDRLENQVDILETEIDKLAVQVNLLNNTVTRLENENDEFERLNARLEMENQEFKELVARFNISNIEFDALLGGLNGTLANLTSQVNLLENENRVLGNLTTQLNSTNTGLQMQVQQLQNTTSNLEAANAALQVENEALSNETARLTNLTQELNGTVGFLSEEVNRLEVVNSDLSVSNTRLIGVVGFLNNTFNSTDVALSTALATLDEAIAASRQQTVENVLNTYQQSLAAWRCDITIDFAGEPFFVDSTIPLGPTNFTSVMTHVNNLVLTNLCLNQTDFERFLDVRFVGSGVLPPVQASFLEVRSGVTQYSTAALNHYFPDATEVGVTLADWDAASYRCENLPQSLRFMFNFAA